MAFVKGIKGKVGSHSISELPVNQLFLAKLIVAIENKSTLDGNKSSTYYTPSGMNCLRQMYYKRTATPQDPDSQAYNDIGMADTGTRRHEAIQEVLIYMTKNNKRFRYIDVGLYIKKRQEKGRCMSIVVQGRDGAETRLWDNKRDVKFRCDGIIYDSLTKKFYLFEFKNQISFKAAGKQSVDAAHYAQINAYCALLELDSALVLYENRDNCELYCPQVFEVSDYDKHLLLSKIDECEAHVKNSKVPVKPTNLASSDCRYCKYKRTCVKEVS